MLSRTAEYLYWISRYMERAETTARLLDVGYRMSLFPNLSGYNNEWESVLAASGSIDSYKKKYNDIVQKHVEDLIASEILNSMINEGDTINIDYSTGKEELNIKIQNKKESKTSKK